MLLVKPFHLEENLAAFRGKEQAHLLAVIKHWVPRCHCSLISETTACAGTCLGNPCCPFGNWGSANCYKNAILLLIVSVLRERALQL